tara:strand:+ start:340 stop:630 length:291 start_codon:yes stop_codon:yes gene_type:complete
MIPQMLLKLLLPKAADYVAKIFKLNKVLKYVEEPNELDIQVRDVEKKCTDIGFKVNAMQTVLKDLGDDSHQEFEKRIEELEEFIKKMKNKKAFKRL